MDENLFRCKRGLGANYMALLFYFPCTRFLVHKIYLKVGNNIFNHFTSSEMLEHIQRKLFVSGKTVASTVTSTVTLLEGDFQMAGELMVSPV